MSKDGIEIEGLERLEEIFTLTGPQAAQNIMRNAVADVARDIRDEAKKRVPVDTGTLKKAIKATRRRGERGEMYASVHVTTGKEAENDGFYWPFVEFGTRHYGPQPFIRPAIAKIEGQINSIFLEKIKIRVIKEIEKTAKLIGKMKQAQADLEGRDK